MDQRDDYADLDLPPPVRWTEDLAPVIAALASFGLMAGAVLLIGFLSAGRP